MKVYGKQIAVKIRAHLKRELKDILQDRKRVIKGKIPKLVVFSVRADDEGRSFITVKGQAVRKLGGSFEWIHYKRTPRFQDFATRIQKVAEDPSTTGVVIQKPLPPSLSTVTLFNYVPVEKEIEGHKKKTPFDHPIGLAVLTILKYIYHPGVKTNIENLIVDMKKDTQFFKQALKRKRVVLIGRGETGGKPIGEMLTHAKINFLNVHSQTPHPEVFYQEADIIITAVGKNVIKPQTLKQGVVLVNVGVRREKDRWTGDYDEAQIKNIADFYTPTPGGTGPLDIAYLMYNLVEAVRLQVDAISEKRK